MLPAPNLDDRRFQDLVDDAKRLVQRRCPTWTDHNVSDPGVTLIEAFAQMTDQLIYRLNRVPDLHYVKFLELIGVELRPPAAARGEVTFWLSAPQPQPVLVRAETQVATPRTDVDDPVVFSTTRDLSDRARARSRTPAPRRRARRRRTAPRRSAGAGFACFSATPRVGDALLIGLSDAVPSCAVLLRLDCTVSGLGVDPRRPPLVWEAWTADGWEACEVDRDETGGLNRPGDVVLHVPEDHQASILARERGGWLRCRVVAARRGPADLQRLAGHRVGHRRPRSAGPSPTVHAEVVRHEVLGRSDGTPAQRFALQRRPVVPGDAPATLVAVAPDGTETTWQQVDALRRLRPGRPALPPRRVRRRGPARPGRPRRGRRARLLRRRAAGGGDAAAGGLPHRRRPGRERRPRAGPGAQDERPVRRPGREPRRGRRRRRGGDARGREGPRAAAAALPGPGGHRGGLRGARPRRRARGRPRALRGRAATNAPASGCSSCRT